MPEKSHDYLVIEVTPEGDHAEGTIMLDTQYDAYAQKEELVSTIDDGDDPPHGFYDICEKNDGMRVLVMYYPVWFAKVK